MYGIPRSTSITTISSCFLHNFTAITKKLYILFISYIAEGIELHQNSSCTSSSFSSSAHSFHLSHAFPTLLIPPTSLTPRPSSLLLLLPDICTFLPHTLPHVTWRGFYPPHLPSPGCHYWGLIYFLFPSCPFFPFIYFFFWALFFLPRRSLSDTRQFVALTFSGSL